MKRQFQIAQEFFTDSLLLHVRIHDRGLGSTLLRSAVLIYHACKESGVEMKGLSIVQRMKANSQQRKRHLKQTSGISF